MPSLSIRTNLKNIPREEIKSIDYICVPLNILFVRRVFRDAFSSRLGFVECLGCGARRWRLKSLSLSFAKKKSLNRWSKPLSLTDNVRLRKLISFFFKRCHVSTLGVLTWQKGWRGLLLPYIWLSSTKFIYVFEFETSIHIWLYIGFLRPYWVLSTTTKTPCWFQ